jgi:hypothetical protein
MDTSDEESDDVVPAKRARIEHSAMSTATNIVTASLNEIINRITIDDLFQNRNQSENLMIENYMYTLDRIRPG